MNTFMRTILTISARREMCMRFDLLFGLLNVTYLLAYCSRSACAQPTKITEIVKWLRRNSNTVRK